MNLTQFCWTKHVLCCGQWQCWIPSLELPSRKNYSIGCSNQAINMQRNETMPTINHNLARRYLNSIADMSLISKSYVYYAVRYTRSYKKMPTINNHKFWSVIMCHTYQICLCMSERVILLEHRASKASLFEYIISLLVSKKIRLSWSTCIILWELASVGLSQSHQVNTMTGWHRKLNTFLL
jgi:hypothetical protein